MIKLPFPSHAWTLFSLRQSATVYFWLDECLWASANFNMVFWQTTVSQNQLTIISKPYSAHTTSGLFHAHHTFAQLEHTIPRTSLIPDPETRRFMKWPLKCSLTETPNTRTPNTACRFWRGGGGLKEAAVIQEDGLMTFISLQCNAAMQIIKTSPKRAYC